MNLAARAITGVETVTGLAGSKEVYSGLVI